MAMAALISDRAHRVPAVVWLLGVPPLIQRMACLAESEKSTWVIETVPSELGGFSMGRCKLAPIPIEQGGRACDGVSSILYFCPGQN